MAASSEPPWNTLPAEIRIIIYEKVLRFKHPIKKRPIKKTGEAVIKKSFSLLLVNKQIHHEALPVLYDCNTISITHMGLHSLLSPARKLDLEHITHLKIRPDLEELRSVTVAASADWMGSHCCIKSTRDALIKVGNDVEFTTVGRFRITGLRDDLEIVVEHLPLVNAWERFAGQTRLEYYSMVPTYRCIILQTYIRGAYLAVL